MSLIQEVFLEVDWDDATEARTARDERAAQLRAEGFTCTCATLYRATDGRQVFLVEAQPPDTVGSERASTRPRPASRQRRPKDNAPQKIEYR